MLVRRHGVAGSDCHEDQRLRIGRPWMKTWKKAPGDDQGCSPGTSTAVTRSKRLAVCRAWTPNEPHLIVREGVCT